MICMFCVCCRLLPHLVKLRTIIAAVSEPLTSDSVDSNSDTNSCENVTRDCGLILARELEEHVGYSCLIFIKLTVSLSRVAKEGHLCPPWGPVSAPCHLLKAPSFGKVRDN